MHALRTRWRTIAVAIVTGMATAAFVPASPAQAQSSCPSVAFSATTWSTGPDTGGFAASITLTNDCRITIDGWTLRLSLAPDHGLQQGWSARWSASGSEVTASSLEWNSVLHTGDSTTIGFIGSFSGTYQDPLACTINGDVCNGGGPEENQPPEVTLTSPQEGQSFLSPCPIQVAADAIDPDGEVARVDFYLNGQLVDSVEEAPYEIVIPGNHPSLGFSEGNLVVAEVFDDGDPALSAATEPVRFFQVVPPPVATFIACAPVVELEAGGSEVVHLVNYCADAQVTMSVTGGPGITVDPTSFEFDFSSGQDLTISAGPGTSGATATVQATSDVSYCSATVQVTVSGSEGSAHSTA